MSGLHSMRNHVRLASFDVKSHVAEGTLIVKQPR